jgi:hypothetical protein
MRRTAQNARKRLRFWSTMFAIVGASLLSGAAAPAQTRAPLVVVELFQSQGCSSCPPANANVNAIADRANVLALSFGVTYWDQLGWKDTFATPQGMARQWDYARGVLHAPNVYTPQIVINGRRAIVGVNRKELEREIVNAAPLGDAPNLVLSGSTLSIGAVPAAKGDADVWLVRYDPRVVQVSVQRGENGGRTLPHKNVVRELVRLGVWRGAAQQYQLPAPRDSALRVAILVQNRGGGGIVAALKS